MSLVPYSNKLNILQSSFQYIRRQSNLTLNGKRNITNTNGSMDIIYQMMMDEASRRLLPYFNNIENEDGNIL